MFFWFIIFLFLLFYIFIYTDVLLRNIGWYYINNKLLYYDNVIYFIFISIFFYYINLKYILRLGIIWK